MNDITLATVFKNIVLVINMINQIIFCFKIPVFQRGGSIVPYKFRIRRSSSQMDNDPFTLVIALDKNVSSYL